MKIGMYYSNNDVRVEESDTPHIGKDELLVRVMASGICGTDVVEWYRRSRIPLVLGHEIAGEIVKTGEGVKKYRAGDRISASHHVPCGSCRYCEMGHHSVCDTLRRTNFDPGGFSEYLRLPAINVKKGVYKLPDSVSYEEATFIEPLACVIRAQKLAGYRKGQDLLVLGSGISGLLHVQLARERSYGKIMATDVNGYRLKTAEKLGADYTINACDNVPEKIKSLNEGRLADMVILCTGAPSAIRQALSSVEKGGTVLFFASTEEGFEFSLSVNDFFWKNETTLTSSYAANPQEHLQALELIKNKKVKVRNMITHRLPLQDIQKGFNLVKEAKESLKVIIEPNNKK